MARIKHICTGGIGHSQPPAGHSSRALNCRHPGFSVWLRHAQLMVFLSSLADFRHFLGLNHFSGEQKVLFLRLRMGEALFNQNGFNIH